MSQNDSTDHPEATGSTKPPESAAAIPPKDDASGKTSEAKSAPSKKRPRPKKKKAASAGVAVKSTSAEPQERMPAESSDSPTEGNLSESRGNSQGNRRDNDRRDKPAESSDSSAESNRSESRGNSQETSRDNDRRDKPAESSDSSAESNRSESRGNSQGNRRDNDRRDKPAESSDSPAEGNRSESSGNSQENRRDNDRRDDRRNNRSRSSRKSGGRRGNNRRRRQDDSDGGPRNEDSDRETGESAGGDESGDSRHPQKTRKQRYQERKEKERAREAAALDAAPAIDSQGIVEISSKGFGFLRESKRGYQQSPKDVFITPEIVRIHGLRDGLLVKCVSKEGLRGPQLIELVSINEASPEEYARLPYFEELTAINPNKKLTLETEATRATTRVIDLIAPIGRGQRGLIVAPPRTGKTTLLHHIAEGIQKNYDDEIHLMVLLVDERPEEVTDFQRSFTGVEIFSSSNDSEAKDHARIALLAIERAKRLVEAGQHVVMLMDSITRLARAFNSQMRGGKGRGTASGGLTVGALEVPRRIFAAARNTREAGSLTIIATALIQTNSKADEAIFQEFKGTGNMELVLDRQIAQNYIYPAVDIHKSGTRREELLLPPHVLEKIYVIRRGLGGYKPVEAMEWLLKCMEKYPTNAQMLMDIKTTALA